MNIKTEYINFVTLQKKLFKMIIKTIFLNTLILFANISFAQDEVLGKWNTIDDETGRKKSIVEIYKNDNKLYGKVLQLFRLPDEDQNPKCDKCDEDDPRYNKLVLGMEVLKGLQWDDDEWDDGTILDPKNGKVYSCKLWLEDGDLQVRGYIGFSFIGRSQTWLRVKEE